MSARLRAGRRGRSRSCSRSATSVLLLLAGDDTKGQNAAFDVVLAVALLVYPTVGAA